MLTACRSLVSHLYEELRSIPLAVTFMDNFTLKFLSLSHGVLFANSSYLPTFLPLGLAYLVPLTSTCVTQLCELHIFWDSFPFQTIFVALLCCNGHSLSTFSPRWAVFATFKVLQVKFYVHVFSKLLEALFVYFDRSIFSTSSFLHHFPRVPEQLGKQEGKRCFS